MSSSTFFLLASILVASNLICSAQSQVSAVVEEQEASLTDLSARSGNHSLNVGEIVHNVTHCFPASSLVTIPRKGKISIENLQVGDRVLTATGEYSQVYTFSHRISDSLHRFRKLCVANSCLTASHGHYIYSRNKLVATGSVQVGDELQLQDGSFKEVIGVQDVWEQGLYNPHTFTGELVVDGFRVSCYTTSITPAVAAGLLAPLKAGFRVVRMDILTAVMEHIRSPWLMQLLPEGAICLQQ